MKYLLLILLTGCANQTNCIGYSYMDLRPLCDLHGGLEDAGSFYVYCKNGIEIRYRDFK